MKKKHGGLALYAVQAMIAKTVVAQYVGQVMKESEWKKNYRDVPVAAQSYSLKFGDKIKGVQYMVDAALFGSLGRYADMSHSPNCALVIKNLGEERVMCIETMMAVAEDDELTVWYGWEADDEQDERLQLECKCGASNCTRRMFLARSEPAPKGCSNDSSSFPDHLEWAMANPQLAESMAREAVPVAVRAQNRGARLLEVEAAPQDGQEAVGNDSLGGGAQR